MLFYLVPAFKNTHFPKSAIVLEIPRFPTVTEQECDASVGKGMKLGKMYDGAGYDGARLSSTLYTVVHMFLVKML